MQMRPAVYAYTSALFYVHIYINILNRSLIASEYFPDHFGTEKQMRNEKETQKAYYGPPKKPMNPRKMHEIIQGGPELRNSQILMK